MYRDTLEAPLARLGLTPNNFHALRVLPLLYVAWSNGKLDDLEREQILTFARADLELNGEAMRLIHQWLTSPPSDETVREGVACLNQLAQAPDQPDLGHDELLQTLWEAETMTRRVAILTGQPYAPSPKQQDALLSLAESMGIDYGVSWFCLLSQLGGEGEVRRTFPESGQGSRPSKPIPSNHDRLRRWRAALRAESSGGSWPARGGLI